MGTIWIRWSLFLDHLLRVRGHCMYIPSAFKESSLPRLQAFVQDHPLATR